MSKEVCTVNSFKKILDTLSESGCGDMPILLGNDTPILNDAICINYLENKLLIRNTYYDKQLVNAASNLKDSIDESIKSYISDCYRAGRESKEE